MHMRLFLPLLALAATPLAAQTSRIASPHPAPHLWTPAPRLTISADSVRASTGAGSGTYIGMGVGAVGGFMLVRFICAFTEGDSCGTDELVGVAVGGLTGAMIGSAFEGGNQTPATH